MNDSETRDHSLLAKHLEQRNVGLLKIEAILGGIMLLLFWLLDLWVISEDHLLLTFSLRLVGSLYAGFIYVAVVKNRDWVSKRVVFFEFSLSYVGAVLIASIGLLHGGYESHYYAGINIVFLVVGLLFVWPTRISVAFCASVYGLYFLPLVTGMIPLEDFGIFISNQVFMVATMVVMVIAHRNRFRLEKSDFFATLGRQRAQEALEKAFEKLRGLESIKSQFFSEIRQEPTTPFDQLLSKADAIDHGKIDSVQNEKKKQTYYFPANVVDSTIATLCNVYTPDRIEIYYLSSLNDQWSRCAWEKGIINTERVSLDFTDDFLELISQSPRAVTLDIIRDGTEFQEVRQSAELFFRRHKCHIVLPLIHRVKILGLVLIGERTNLTPYSLEDYRFLEQLGDGASIGLSNALLFSKAEDQRRELEKAWRHQRLLSSRLIEAKEKESARISRELHDVLGQLLTGAKIDLGLVGKQLGRNPDSFDVSKCNSRIKGALGSMDQAILSVQQLTKELRPPMLDDIGLAGTLEWMISEYGRRTKLTTEFENNIEDEFFDPSFATVVYRVVQESLTNVARHARASIVNILVTEKGDKLDVVVKDDGVGITPEQLSDPHSVGIFGMMERVRLIGGQLRVTGEVNEGTTVHLSMEIKRGD